jgi:hypothetical protein
MTFCLDGLKKSTKNLSQDSRSFGQNSIKHLPNTSQECYCYPKPLNPSSERNVSAGAVFSSYGHVNMLTYFTLQ